MSHCRSVLGLPLAWLLVGTAAYTAEPAKRLPTQTQVAEREAVRADCGPPHVEPAGAARAANSEDRGKQIEAITPSTLTLGVFYSVDGCPILLTTDGLRPVPPKGSDGRRVPLIQK